MSTEAPPRYLVWRVADMASYIGASANRRDGGLYQRSTCSECGEPVWFQPAHREDRVLICWGCAE